MPTLTIDDQPIDVVPGITILEAARRLGIQIPTLCHREGCTPETSCMVCVVRIGGSQKLVPSCATVAAEGMAVESETDEVHAARTMALELLLGDHLGDCVGPCHTICPAHMDIPKMIRQIVAGQMDAAVETVTASIPIPAILGRICPELCEKGCRRGSLDSPIAIRLLKRFVGDYALSLPASLGREHAPSSGRAVAIVGAGPAGLSAAYYLALQGHACTVLDAFSKPGGRLRYAAVPESALPREVLDAELDRLLAVGIELRPNTTVGTDVSLQELRGRYDAVLIATGDMQLNPGPIPDLQATGTGVNADRRTQMTAIPGVFVAGGALSPSRHAVRAVGSGHAAAMAISLYLTGGSPLADHRPYTVTMGRLDEEELTSFAKGYPRLGRLSPVGEEAAGFGTDEARREGDRCLRCDCAGIEKCRLRDWGVAYEASPAHYKDRRRRYQAEATHPDIVYEPGKCINCGLCVQIAERSREALGLAFVGRGFTVRVAVPFGESFAEGLREVAEECAAACPTGAIVLRERPLYAPATN